MIKRVIVLPDIHLTTKLPKAYVVAKKFVKDYKPDEIILLGDFMDCESLSHWNECKRRMMENKRYIKECKTATKELDFLQANTKTLTYLEGNHENWVEQYIDKNPEMEGLIELPMMLKLKERGIKWVKFNQLYHKGHCYFTHGLYVNKFSAAKHLTTLGCNIVYGHGHIAQTHMMNMKMQKPIMAYALGCLCGMLPEYLKGKTGSWINQFAIYEYEDKTGEFNLLPVNLINNRFIYDGRLYQ